MIKVIAAKGSNYNIGYSIGKKTKEKINFFLDQKKVLTKNQKLIEKLLKFCHRHYPQYVEEIRGMAAGSETSFKKLFSYNLGLSTSHGCTTLVLKKKKRVLMGHNEDLSNGDIFLVRILHKNKLKSLNISYYGFLPGFSVSINSKGLIQTMNGMTCRDKDIGLPNAFLSRATIEANNIQEAADIIIKNKRLHGGNFTFYQKDKFVNVETTATRHALTSSPTCFVHTNHYLSKELLPYEAKKNLSNSVSRLVQAKTLIQVYKKKSFKTLKKILSSHHDPPNTICRHIKKFRAGNRTAGTILINSNKKEMKICYRNPCQSKFYTYKL